MYEDIDREKRERQRAALDAMRIKPNPKLVALMDYAIDEVVARLHNKEEYREWLEWAAAWKGGQRSPQACVDISHLAQSNYEIIGPSLSQLAWGAKEACYSAPTSGWLVIRYIADAMHAFGVAFPENGTKLLEPPTVDTVVAVPQTTITKAS